MHGFGTPVKRPPDSITPGSAAPYGTTSTLQKYFPIKKKKARETMFPTSPAGLQCVSPHATSIPLPCLSLTNRENREQGFYKVKNLGRGGGLEGNPSLEGFPSPSTSHNNLLPERHAHVAVDEHVRLHVLADGLRRGGGKLREDFVGIAL